MKLAVLISFSGEGGVERMVLNLIREFTIREKDIDLLVIRASSQHFYDIPPSVNIIKLRAKHTLTAIPEICRYLRRVRPDALLVAKDRAARAALIARLLAQVKTRIVVRLGTNLSAALKHKSKFNRWLRVTPMRRIYVMADKIIAVSEGVKKDTLSITGLQSSRVVTVRNPVVTPDFKSTDYSIAPHAWFKQKTTIPVVVGVGRLSKQKGFDVLIKAFAMLNRRIDSRLIILGEGKDRAKLESLIAALKLQDKALLPGFKRDVLKWVAHANVFVLSSRWEGSPNSLTEALALGIPSVATDCPSGPSEILAGGKYGPLIKLDDETAMSEAIFKVIREPLPATILKDAVREYHSDSSAERYLQILRGAI